MQTFLPYPDFHESARVLDRQRLGKQRVEAMQCLHANLEGTKWASHPAAKMWRTFEPWLARYAFAIIGEWDALGYRDTCRGKICDLLAAHGLLGAALVSPGVQPWWLGDPAFHLSHRANLVRKNPEYYGPKFPDVTDATLPYVWPAQEGGR